MAAAFALAMPSISAALPGVAIATALMPPLGMIGIGIAMGRWEVAGGALLLFLTNAVTIAFAGMLVFFALGFAPDVKQGGMSRARWPFRLVLRWCYSCRSVFSAPTFSAKPPKTVRSTRW